MEISSSAESDLLHGTVTADLSPGRRDGTGLTALGGAEPCCLRGFNKSPHSSTGPVRLPPKLSPRGGYL
ncbi:hypothetical protein AAFF_G00282700 [Aldrovandia affinis]|uniref:Uncharacterized protein n=1 Tax=Aldrovandia affinis TaxID=143900 RepID=A0AAD7X1T8_9TELE|nr:hypothetical protein AAFF_G00282700 [Aldrovandia affinis]